MLRGLRDLNVERKRVLVRVDFNVPLQAGKVANDKRIREALPTINYLIEHRAKTILTSHLGRPEGRVVEELRLTPVAARLSELLARPVRKLDDCIGPEVEQAVARMSPGEVVLLENLRFHEGEEANDPEFARALAKLAEVYVDDAFGTAHRKHASNYGVARLLPSAAGLLMEQEIKNLSRLRDNPQRPFLAIVGGKKAEDKIGVLFDLLGKVDAFLIGGGVAFTFLKVQGHDVGRSIVDESQLAEAKRFLDEAQRRGVTVVLPRDVRIAREASPQAEAAVAEAERIPSGWIGLDIGPETAAEFARRVREARTVLWTGPLGAFELPQFSGGTKAVAEALAKAPAFSVIGGGETAAAVEQLGLAKKMGFISTGGGAMLHFLRGKELPAVEPLRLQ
ncbi:MAG: phosphoglycerate kinase [Candidatus Acetothermia bacterium]|nr:phosphoglycerate kinase [Candidatus Acetothermia bacterium]MDH7504955.1 phosphoglycerate kinase [Candidatus Acetothermia bacterium]